MDDLSQSARPARAPSFSPIGIAILLFAFTFGGFITIGALTQFMNVAFGLWFTEVFIFFGVPFVVLRTVGRDPLRYAGVLPAPPSSAFALGFSIGLTNLFAIGLPLQLLSYFLLPESIRNQFDATQVFKNQTQLELTFVLLGVAVLAAVCEEFFFRGVLLKGLRDQLRSDWAALAISGFLFAFAHLEPIGFLARWELGILFGWLYLRTRSIWPAVMAHAANNLTSTVMYFLSPDTEKAASTEVGPEEVRQILIIAVFALVPLILLVRYAARHLTPVVPEDDPARLLPRSFWLNMAPWLGAALAAMALLFAVDRRGVELNFVDARYPLPKLERDTRKQQRAELDELRKRARSGQVPTEEYRERRAALSKETP